jgi:hypothetical protein
MIDCRVNPEGSLIVNQPAKINNQKFKADATDGDGRLGRPSEGAAECPNQ